MGFHIFQQKRCMNLDKYKDKILKCKEFDGWYKQSYENHLIDMIISDIIDTNGLDSLITKENPLIREYLLQRIREYAKD